MRKKIFRGTQSLFLFYEKKLGFLSKNEKAKFNEKAVFLFC